MNGRLELDKFSTISLRGSCYPNVCVLHKVDFIVQKIAIFLRNPHTKYQTKGKKFIKIVSVVLEIVLSTVMSIVI